MQKIIYFFGVVTWLCTLAVLPSALAENRALLVGVGQYRVSSANLIGIDKDIRMMKEVAGLAGFSSGQVKVLEDSQATLAGIEQAIKEWLISGVTPKDRVLFYFSGHGSQIPDKNGDEKDKADEVLVPHDVAVDGNTLKNVFVDEQFGEILSQIPAKDIFVFIDACHSGTAYKSFNLPDGDVKFFYYKGMPQTKGNFAVEEDSSPAEAKYVGLSACQDDEVARPSAKGSYFTLGIYEAFKKAGSSLTMKDLERMTGDYLENHLPADKVHHPQLSGDDALAEKNIIMTSARPKPENLWAKLEYLADKAHYKLDARVNKDRFKVKELLELTCHVDRAGYLNVLNVSPDDKQATVLYPNRFHKENRVSAGSTIRIPAPGDGFKLRCTPPLGKSLIVVFQTKDKINAYEQGKGSLDALFKTISADGFKANFEIIADSKGGDFGAAKITTEVVE